MIFFYPQKVRSKTTIFYQWSRVRGIQYRKGITPLDLLQVLSSRPPDFRDFHQKEQQMTTQISTFNFKSNSIRIEVINNEPFFALKDVCDALAIKVASPERFRLNFEGVTRNVIPTSSGNQELTFINEPNLYRIIFRSNKAEAIEFQNWIFEEVLPQIRKTGKYEISQPALPMPEPTYAQSFSQQDIDNLVWLLFSHERMRFLLENLYKPLALLNSPFAPQVYGNVTEYKRVHKIAKPLIKKLLDKLQSDNPEKWRHLTRYLNNEIC